MTATPIRLEHIETHIAKATAGPWWLETSTTGVGSVVAFESPRFDLIVASSMYPADAEFVVAARKAMPALVAALRAVLELHKPRVYPAFDVRGLKFPTMVKCEHCVEGAYEGEITEVEWPCPTARALIDAGIEVPQP